MQQVNDIDLEICEGVSERLPHHKNTVREGIAEPGSMKILNSSHLQQEGGILIEKSRGYPARVNTPMHEVYRKNTNNNHKPVQPIRL